MDTLKVKMMYCVSYALADGTEYADNYSSILDAVAAYNSITGSTVKILNMFIGRVCYMLEMEGNLIK